MSLVLNRPPELENQRAAKKEPQMNNLCKFAFGLKGRFCQPRPKAWAFEPHRHSTL